MVVVLLAVPSSSYVVAYSFLPEVDEVDDTSFVLVGEKEEEASSSCAAVVAVAVVVDAYLMVVSSSVEASSSSADDVGASFVHVDVDVEEVVGLPYYFLLSLWTAVYYPPTWR